MHKICTYCLLKERLGVLKRVVVLFILYLAFFGAIWLFSRVDLAFFAYDYLATLLMEEIASDLPARC